MMKFCLWWHSWLSRGSKFHQGVCTVPYSGKDRAVFYDSWKYPQHRSWHDDSWRGLWFQHHSPFPVVTTVGFNLNRFSWEICRSDRSTDGFEKQLSQDTSFKSMLHNMKCKMYSRHITNLLQCLSHILLQFSFVFHLRTHLIVCNFCWIRSRCSFPLSPRWESWHRWWCRALGASGAGPWVPAVTRPGSTLLWRPTPPPPPPPPPLIPPRCPVELPSPLPSTYALEGFNRELSTPQKWFSWFVWGRISVGILQNELVKAPPPSPFSTSPPIKPASEAGRATGGVLVAFKSLILVRGAWDDGREGALHHVQEQEHGGAQRQPGQGEVSRILRPTPARIDFPPSWRHCTQKSLSLTHAHGSHINFWEIKTETFHISFLQW